jgi:hypothetical protein
MVAGRPIHQVAVAVAASRNPLDIPHRRFAEEPLVLAAEVRGVLVSKPETGARRTLLLKGGGHINGRFLEAWAT